METLQIQDYVYNIDIQQLPNYVNQKDYVTQQGKSYQIYNYNRDMLTDDSTDARLYKSVIVSDAKIKSMCPPKSIPYHIFSDKYPLNDDIAVSKLVEGTMINMFYDNDRWNIHTRGAIGGQYFYFRNQYYVDQFSDKRQISFYDMFMECLQAGDKEELNDLEFLNLFPKNYVYSFVMQHPDNHIVIPVERPQLYLTHVYRIQENGVCNIHKFLEHPELQSLRTLDGIIKIPEGLPNKDSFKDMVDCYCGIQQDYEYTGLAFYNWKTGERSVYKNPSYVEMKELRGNNPNLQYQYLCLRRVNKVKDFLNYFPVYKKLFFKFYNQYKTFMKNVHQSYYHYYIKKSLSHVNNKFMPHIYRIHHNVYLPSLGALGALGDKADTTPKVITIGEVYKYFDSIDIGELLFALNYDNRKATSTSENGRT